MKSGNHGWICSRGYSSPPPFDFDDDDDGDDDNASEDDDIGDASSIDEMST